MMFVSKSCFLIFLLCSLSLALRLEVRAPDWSSVFNTAKNKGIKRQTDLENLQPGLDKDYDCDASGWYQQNLGKSTPNRKIKSTFGLMGLSLTDDNYWEINVAWPKDPNNPMQPPDPKSSAWYFNMYNPVQQVIVADAINKPAAAQEAGYWSDVTWTIWKNIPGNTNPGGLKYVLHKNVQSQDGRPILEEIFSNIPKGQWSKVQTWNPADDEYSALLGCINGGTVVGLLKTHSGPLNRKTVQSVQATARGQGGSKVEYDVWWTLGN